MKIKSKELQLLITDAVVIANITNPTNWSGYTYVGSLVGLYANQIYFDGNYRYEFNGTTLYRMTFWTGMLLPVSGAGSPVGVVTPRYVGDEYIDMSGPTRYWSYGLTNVDWIF